ncbi:uncharacterized protein LOC109837056 [Asparagus officinalis]|nr:uncharacterized protein LOC109837056 [Asparagus officinalis]
MNWLRKERVGLMKLTLLLSRASICSVFSRNGIHFLPVRHQQNRILDRYSVSGGGFCKIHGGREFVPLLSIDYSAIPSYFKYLYATTILGSQYLSSNLGSKHLVAMTGNSLVVALCEEHFCGDDIPSETGFSGTDFTVSETAAVKMDKLPTLAVTSLLGSQKSVIIHGAELRKLQRKRSTLTKTKRSFGSLGSTQKISPISSRIRDFAVPPVSVIPLNSPSPDLLNGREENVIASFPGSSSMLRKSVGMKTSIDEVKEVRLALAQVRQNIDSACCNVNILVTDTEKGWREDGAQVMLEMSGSQEWVLAVKRENVMRFLYKPQDLKLCTVNKYTHAYIWSGDEKWKLEFCEKLDWHIFKELHKECRDRNTSLAFVKTVPIPGVKEVSGYEVDVVPSFVQPDTYIRSTEDEVGRAVASAISYYNMDVADEEWLQKLNSRLSDAEGGGPSFVSEENFERVIFALEKIAYCCRDDAFDKEKALDLLQEFGRRDAVSAVYSYWLKRRKQKRGPIARVFQGLSLRRTEVNRKSSWRKKRSFKRRQSQTERNQAEWKNQIRREKQELFFKAYREAIRRARESKGAVSRAAENATQLRSKAQVLMSNADLAAYKASMAFRISETISTSSSLLSSESPNLNSYILID